MENRRKNLLQGHKFLQSSVSLFFPQQPRVVEMEEGLTQVFAPKYQPPEQVTFPGDPGPEAPRLVFRSQHGFSQIVVSQSTIVLTVHYSPQWQLDLTRGEEYLQERLPLLHDAVTRLAPNMAFAGVGTVAQFPLDKDGELIRELARIHGGGLNNDKPYDIDVRMTSVVDDRYFRNITLRNYRSWSVPPFTRGLLRLSTANQTDQGLELSIDFNDRYAYNELADYTSDLETAQTILERGFIELRELIQALEEGTWL